MALSVQQSQRQLIACALEVLADADFALAGSGAIREHGIHSAPPTTLTSSRSCTPPRGSPTQ